MVALGLASRLDEVLLLNTDPQGISVDNLRFEGYDMLG
jgi:hypothetical protein